MFVRWITRPYVTPERDGSQVALSAVLVESKRINGQPRQRHIAYLGGIRESGIQHARSRQLFWNDVTAALDKIHNQIEPDDRARFEAAIAARVPRPTAKELEDIAGELKRQEARRLADELTPEQQRMLAFMRVIGWKR